VRGGGEEGKKGTVLEYKCDKLRILLYYYIACVVRVGRGGEVRVVYCTVLVRTSTLAQIKDSESDLDIYSMSQPCIRLSLLPNL